MESKKISFGFMKTKKAERPVVEEKKDYIECVEEKSIKVVGGEEVEDNTPLVIPMKPNTLVTAERLREIAEKVESALDEPEVTEKPPSPVVTIVDNETLDQMAVRELLQESKKKVTLESPAMTVPLPAKPVNEGEKESTLDDYEAVPIQDFGLAMLRGMGWTPNNEKSKYKPPQLRPKGLGLGADKVVKDNQKKKPSKDGKDEELTIVKNAYVKITSGKYSGYYGKVLSLDEDNGRVMVDITVKKETVSLSEFMMQPVTKSEFDKESKVINADSYNDYKKQETSQKSSKKDKESNSGNSNNDRNYRADTRNSERDATSSKNYGRKYDEEKAIGKDNRTKNGKDYNVDERKEIDRDRSHRRDRRDSADGRYSRKKDRKYSSNESLNSLSDSERRKYKKKERKRYSSQDSLSSESDTDKKRNKKKERRKQDSSDSESDYRSKRHKTPEGKRDIDKKRKGKRKKRDRDRSPNYRKHRK